MKSLLYWAFVLSLVAGLLVAGGVKSARAWHVGEPTDKLFDDMIEKAQREQEEAPHYWERQAEKEQEFQDRLQERRVRDCYLSRCQDDDDPPPVEDNYLYRRSRSWDDMNTKEKLDYFK